MGWREGQRWKLIQRLRNPINSCWLRQEGKNAWNKWKLNFQIANIFASEAHSTNNTLFRLSLSRFFFLVLLFCFVEKAIHYNHLKFKIVIKKRLIYSVRNDISKCKRNNMYLNGCDCRELICLFCSLNDMHFFIWSVCDLYSFVFFSMCFAVVVVSLPVLSLWQCRYHVYLFIKMVYLWLLCIWIRIVSHLFTNCKTCDKSILENSKGHRKFI